VSLPLHKNYNGSGIEWLGKVPTHWKVMSLGKVTLDKCDGPFGSGLKSEHYTDEGVRVIRLQNVRGGKFDSSDAAFIDEKYYRDCLGGHDVQPGDLVVAGLGDDRNTVGRACVAPAGISPAMVKADCFRFRLNPGIAVPAFVAAQLTAGSPYDAGILSSGSTRSRIPLSAMAARKVAIPPLAEQSSIVNFLDSETAKIDALVNEQKRLIELLTEKRQAVISHAVTKGLNPNAPTKNSGVDWIGNVPGHWEIVPLAKFTIDRCDGPFGSGLKSAHYTDDGVRVIRLQNIRRDGFDASDAAYIDASYYEQSLIGHDVRPGDVLIAGLGDDRNTVGRACIAPIGIEPAMVKADCFRFRLDSERALPEFVAMALSAGAPHDAGLLSSGSTRSRIPLSVMATRKVPLPQIDEQRIIVERLVREQRKFDELATYTEAAIVLLQERRSALIAAAVTGKIDVRGLVSTKAEAA